MIASEGTVTGSPLVWLRLESFSVLMLAVLVYRAQHASWLLFGLLFFAPDLAMIGYLVGAKVGAAIYNTMHSYALPAALAAFAFATGHVAALPFALIWSAHIGFDRMLGYGLKYDSAFGHTHLGRMGKQKLEETA